MKLILKLLTGGMAVAALVTGILMVVYPAGNVLGITPALLRGSGLSNYTIPGLLLIFVIGSCNLLAWVHLVRSGTRAFTYSMVSGVLVLGCILVQMLISQAFHWMQGFFLGAALMILLISLQLKGRSLI